jgi:hypothetical protein
VYKLVWIIKGKSNAGDNMTSYVNANSNVIKSYAKKQEKRKEKKIILPNENNRFKKSL